MMNNSFYSSQAFYQTAKDLLFNSFKKWLSFQPVRRSSSFGRLKGCPVGCLLSASSAVKDRHSFPRPPPFSNRLLFLNLNQNTPELFNSRELFFWVFIVYLLVNQWNRLPYVFSIFLDRH